MICTECDVLTESLGYGDEQCPECGKTYYSDFENDDDDDEDNE